MRPVVPWSSLRARARARGRGPGARARETWRRARTKESRGDRKEGEALASRSCSRVRMARPSCARRAARKCRREARAAQRTAAASSRCRRVVASSPLARSRRWCGSQSRRCGPTRARRRTPNIDVDRRYRSGIQGARVETKLGRDGRRTASAAARGAAAGSAFALPSIEICAGRSWRSPSSVPS